MKNTSYETRVEIAKTITVMVYYNPAFAGCKFEWVKDDIYTIASERHNAYGSLELILDYLKRVFDEYVEEQKGYFSRIESLLNKGD